MTNKKAPKSLDIDDRDAKKIGAIADALDIVAQKVVNRIKSALSAGPDTFFLHGINGIQVSFEVGIVKVSLAIDGTTPGIYECTPPKKWNHKPKGTPTKTP